MGLIVKNKKGVSIPPMAAGTYISVCVGIVDLGEQYSEKFKKYSDKVLVIWEIPSQTIEVDGELKPRWLSKDFASSLNEKSNLCKFLVPWRGRAFSEEELDESGAGFDLKTMLGTGCMLSVTIGKRDDGSEYNAIAASVGLPDGIPVPTTATELIAFDTDAWDDKVFESLPEWVRDRIKKSTQYQKLHAPDNAVDFKEPLDQPTEKGACPI